MATIICRTGKDGQTAYLVRVRRKRTPPQTATFVKLSDVRKWAQTTEGAIAEGRYFSKAEAKRHTLTELIDRYLADVLPHKQPSTVPDQERQLRWWKAQLGHYALADITPALIAGYRDTRRRGTGKRRTHGTVVRYLAALSHAFTMAVKEWQWCDANTVRAITKPKEPRWRVRFLSDQERHSLLAACQASRKPLPAYHRRPGPLYGREERRVARTTLARRGPEARHLNIPGDEEQ